jgi:predicted ester cyclase
MKRTTLLLALVSFLFVACNNDKKDETTEKKDGMSSDNKGAMTSSSDNKAEKNRQTAMASVNAVNAHDVDGVMKDVAADAVDYGDGSMAPTKSVDSVKSGLKAWLAAFPDVKGENLEVYSNADGSKVIVVGQWSGTFKNDFMGMKATGKSYKVWDGDVFTFNDAGKITSHRGIQSGMVSMMQVGAKLSK